MPRTPLLSCLLVLITLCGCGAEAPDPVAPTDATRQPDSAPALAARGEQRYGEGDYEGAIADLRAALATDSTNLAYHYLLSDVYLDYYRSRLALRTLEDAARLVPDNPATLLRLAKTQLILRQYDDALASLNALSRVDPRNAEAFLLLSQLFLEQDDRDRALQAAEEATRIDPDLTDAYLIQADLRAERGDPRAGDYYDAAIGIDPTDPYPLHAKGNYLRDRDDLAGAIAHYRRASLADRQFVLGHYNAGLLLMELDSVEQAHREFHITVSNDPTHARGFFFRGYASEQLGQTDAARRDYRRAAQLDPELELATEALQRLGD